MAPLYRKGSSVEIPASFIKYLYIERRELVLKALRGDLNKEELLIGFTRHTPAFVTQGPAGLNASIKGVGFLPREAYLHAVLRALRRFIQRPDRNLKEALEVLLEYVYPKEYHDKIDFTKLVSLELARKHTYINLQYNNVVTLLFYTPPNISYEVRGTVAIHMGDEYWEYANLVHDAFHTSFYRGRRRDWSKIPAYVIEIHEIYDNSPRKMGERIYPMEE